MSSGQHDRLVFGLVAIGILLVALGLLAAHQLLAAGAGVVVAQLVGAFSMTRTDNTALVMLLIFAAATLGYLAYVFTGRRERVRVPDYPPAG